MRSGAGTSYSVINSISRGTMVDYTGNKTKDKIDGHYWAKVTYNNTTGWVAATYLGVNPIEENTNSKTEPFGAIYGIYYEATWVGPYVVSSMKNKDDVIILDSFKVAATSPEAAEELKAVEASEIEFIMSASMMSGGVISGYTKHGLAQAIGRDGGRGVSPKAISDAVKNPQKIVNQAGETIKYIGENATVVLNKVREVVTTWARNHLGLRW